MIADAQLHIWAAESPGRPWPPGGAAAAHRAGEVLAEELLREMDAAGVARAVLVPPSWEGDRNDVALDAAERHPDRFAVMGRLPVADRSRALALLSGHTGRPGMLGLRFTFHRQPLAAMLATGALDWLWKELENADVPVMLYPPGLLRNVGEVAERHPRLRLAVDHLALPAHLRGPEAFGELDELIALARHPNLCVKASCLPASSTERYPFADVRGHLRRVFDAYGPERMFWGSDRTRLPCTYRECVEHFTHTLPFLCGRDRELVMGEALLDWIGWRR